MQPSWNFDSFTITLTPAARYQLAPLRAPIPCRGSPAGPLGSTLAVRMAELILSASDSTGLVPSAVWGVKS